VVVIGSGKLVDAAHSYGFRRPISSSEYVRLHRDMYPLSARTLDRISQGRPDAELEALFPERFERVAAVLVMHDPLVAAMRDLQILVDIARSPSGVPGDVFSASTAGVSSFADVDVSSARNRPAEIHFSNPDLLFSSTFHVPRFGQGAFRVACEAVYRETRDQDPFGHLWPDPAVAWAQYGKPTRRTFDFARTLLERQSGAVIMTMFLYIYFFLFLFCFLFLPC
jgi:ribonucleotide monophosphatase NagD (HAD superfamily)